MFYTSSITTKRYTVIVGLLSFFFIDELAFILYNISFFQFMCATTFSFFFTDEIPTYTILYFADMYNTVYIDTTFCVFDVFYSVQYLKNSSTIFLLDINTLIDDRVDVITFSTIDGQGSSDTYYKIKLEATNVKKQVISFYPLQQYIYTIPGESSLIFYRLDNKSECTFHTVSVYVTTPAEAVAYIKKLQCFCYEELLVAPHSIIDLPILFSIDEEILNEEFKEITINYILLLK